MELHPACALFPPLPEEQLCALADDIKARGQLEPIEIWQGRIIDGRNRWLACEKAGVRPITRDYEAADEAEVISEIVSRNLKRRHLSETERARLGSKLVGMYEEAASARKKGGQFGVYGARRSATTDEGEPASKPARASESAARDVNVSPRMVQQARTLDRHATPELQALVDAGEVKLSPAVTVALDCTKDEQVEVASGGGAAVKRKAAEIRERKAAEKAARAEADTDNDSDDAPEPAPEPEKPSDPEPVATAATDTDADAPPPYNLDGERMVTPADYAEIADLALCWIRETGDILAVGQDIMDPKSSVTAARRSHSGWKVQDIAAELQRRDRLLAWALDDLPAGTRSRTEIEQFCKDRNL